MQLQLEPVHVAVHVCPPLSLHVWVVICGPPLPPPPPLPPEQGPEAAGGGSGAHPFGGGYGVTRGVTHFVYESISAVHIAESSWPLVQCSITVS